jgi:transcriptional regulator with XRE-family HTH domain
MPRRSTRTYRNLTSYLAETGMNQVELAAMLGKSQPYISKLIRGLHQPPLDEALRIAAKCRIPVESLVSVANELTEGK